MLGSSGRRAGPAARLLVSLVPFRDECLMRSRMVDIADAPACRVIWLRRVTQLMAQMNLLVVRYGERPAILNCPIILGRESVLPSRLTFIRTFRPAFFFEGIDRAESSRSQLGLAILPAGIIISRSHAFRRRLATSLHFNTGPNGRLRSSYRRGIVQRRSRNGLCAGNVCYYENSAVNAGT